MMIPTGVVLFDLPRLDTWMIIERPRPSLYHHDPERPHPTGHNGHIATLPEPWPPGELKGWAFSDPPEAAQRLPPLLIRRINEALNARADGCSYYLEDGVRIT